MKNVIHFFLTVFVFFAMMNAVSCTKEAPVPQESIPDTETTVETEQEEKQQEQPTPEPLTAPDVTFPDGNDRLAYTGEITTITFHAEGDDLDSASVTTDDRSEAECTFDNKTGNGTVSITLKNSVSSTLVTLKVESTRDGEKTVSESQIRVTAYYLDIKAPKQITMNGEEGETQPYTYTVKTNVPEGEYTIVLSVDVDWLAANENEIRSLEENRTDDVRSATVSIRDEAGRFRTVTTTVTQDSTKPEPKEGCVPFDSWAFKKAAVAQGDTDGDGELSFEEATKVKTLDISNLGIKTVEELKYFNRLEKLDCSGNRIKDLNLGDVRSFAFLRDIDARNNDDHIVIEYGGCWSGFGFMLKYINGRYYDFQGTLKNTSAWGTYESTDFTQAGIEKLQTHTKGKGIILCFDTRMQYDLDYMSGAARSWMQVNLDGLFSKEPFKTLRDYFDIYYCKYLDEVGYGTNPETLKYQEEIKINYEECSEFTVCVKMEPTGSMPNTTFFDKGSKPYIGPQHNSIFTEYPRKVFPIIQDDGFHIWDIDDFKRDVAYTICHEAGHCIGGLADQYKAKNNHPCLNFSYSGNPEDVEWKMFLDHPKYKERVGIYELYEGYFYPSPTSVMHSDSEYDFYDSPSRFSIFEDIIQFANMEKTPFGGIWTIPDEKIWQMFLEYDVINDDLPY